MIELPFARVTYGVSPSPLLLNVTVKHHLELFLPTHTKTVTSFLQSINVDVAIFGVENEESAYQLYQEPKEILESGSFILRKFTSSHPLLLAWINQAESVESPSSVLGDLDETFAQTTLGGGHQPRRVSRRF